MGVRGCGEGGRGIHSCPVWMERPDVGSIRMGAAKPKQNKIRDAPLLSLLQHRPLLHFTCSPHTWKRFTALSLGTERAQLEQRMNGVWPRPFLFLPPLRLFLVILLATEGEEETGRGEHTRHSFNTGNRGNTATLSSAHPEPHRSTNTGTKAAEIKNFVRQRQERATFCHHVNSWFYHPCPSECTVIKQHARVVLRTRSRLAPRQPSSVGV